MSVRRRLLGATAGAVGLAAAGTAVGVARQRRAISRRRGEQIPFGSLHSPPITVVTDDGVPLHVEVDEVDEAEEPVRLPGRPRRPRLRGPGPVTVVFVHGYCLNLDCWHFQRAAYRGLLRTVFYDQRSHGRSGRSPKHTATIDQLGRDLGQVVDVVAPDGPVVLVGHSMGGMAIVALAEQRPELFGDKVTGVGLISTTAGGLDPARILLPIVPTRLSGTLTQRAVSALSWGHRVVDQARRVGRAIAIVGTDVFAFGDEVPSEYVEFVDEMLSATPFETVAEFFPSFRSLDKFDHVEVMSRVPTVVVCGTEDRLTSIGHSRKLHSRVPGSRLVECEGAGHMVQLERHEQVTAELDQLVASAAERAAAR